MVLATVAVVTAFFFTHDATWDWLGLGHMSRSLFVVPPLVWAALRLRPQGAFLAVAVMALVTVWLTVLGHGPFTHDAAVDDLLELQLMLAAVGGTMLVLVGAIAERDRAATDMMQARRQADEANLAKSRFVAAVRHDLGQPLQAAMLFLGAIREQLPEERGQVLVHPQITVFSVNAVLGQLAEEYRVQAAECGLQFRCSGCTVPVATDRQLLGRILRNLLSNAMRYTDRGRILLGCRRIAGGVRIEVWDTGPGIPPTEQEVIFEAFHRGAARRRDILGPGDTGLGLGLATVRRLTGLLGLNLTLRSTVGKGSVFAVVVPTAGLAADRRAAA